MDRPMLGILMASAVLLAPMGACSVGTSAENVRPAQSPYGVSARLEISDDDTREGELLEVRDDGLLILVAGRVTLFPWGAIRGGQFTDAPGAGRLREGEPPGTAQRERLRLLSRYPWGLTEEHLDRLLAAHGQERVDVVEGR